MKRDKLILAFVLVLTLSTLSIAIYSYFFGPSKTPIAKDGVLDLRDWNFEQNGSIHLDGEWSFFGDRLLTPKETLAQKRTGTIMVPDFLDPHSEKTGSFSENGYGTYQLLIRLPKNSNSERLGVNPENPSSAFKLFADQQKVLQVGKVGITKESSDEHHNREIASFYSTGEKLLLTIQVSNHSHKDGGNWYRMQFGPYFDLVRKEMLVMGFCLFAFSGMIVMSIHYFGIYFQRKKEKGKETEYLTFSLICFIFAIRAIYMESHFLCHVIPESIMDLDLKLEIVTTFSLPPLFVLFFDQIFPMKKEKLFTWGVITFFLTLSILALIVSYSTFLMFWIPVQIGIVVVCARIILKIVRIAWKDQDPAQRKEALILTLGIFILITNITYDLFFKETFDDIAPPGTVGMLIFLLSMSMVMSKRISNSFNTVQEQNRELQRLNQVKDNFLANTTHELRTPLHAITGISESLLETCRNLKNSESIRKNISLVHSSAQYLSNLVNDILDTTTLKHEKLKISTVSLNLYPIVQEILDFHMPMIRKKELRLINDIPIDISPVLADELRLRQIFQNFLSNAIKFTESGTIRVEAKLEGEFLSITIHDTGKGISKENLASIFQAFEQVNPYASKKERGTGLGLYITKKLIKLHGGTVTVASEPGQGSAFTFTLPISDQPAKNGPVVFTATATTPKVDKIASDQNQSEVQNEMENQDSLWNILVVDDDPINLHVVCEFLAEGSYHPIPCESGEEALELLESELPDLVLLDVMMPGIDGFEVCQRIRAQYTADQLPVVFLTACNDASQLIQGFDVGGNDYLTKPFPKAKLIASISPLLERNVQKGRLSALRELFNQIGTVKDKQALIRFAFQQLCKERYILRGALYKGDTVVDEFREGVEQTLLRDLAENTTDEITQITEDDKHYLLIKLKNFTTLRMVFQCQLALNGAEKEFMASIIDHLKMVQNSQTKTKKAAIDPKILAQLSTVASNFDQTLFIQASENYCIIHKVRNKTEIIRLPLKKLKQNFEDDFLLQVHRSYLINPSKIESIKKTDKSRYQLILIDVKDPVPIGQTYLPNLQAIFPDIINEVV